MKSADSGHLLSISLARCFASNVVSMGQVTDELRVVGKPQGTLSKQLPFACVIMTCHLQSIANMSDPMRY